MKLINLYWGYKYNDLWNVILCGFLRILLPYRKSRLVEITTLELGHQISPEHPKTAARIKELRLDSVKRKRTIESNYLNGICESDCDITVLGNMVINGNGRVSALRAAGFTGRLEVKTVGF